LDGATIQQVSESKSAIVDETGNFEISIPKHSRLTISIVGYKTKTISASGKEVPN
jgi:hypothetical protein